MSTTIRLAEIIEALSKALDLTGGQPQGHCIRTCFIGTAIGRELGLSEDVLQDLYYALLLKDLGCSSNAARICDLYMTDDHAIKHDFKLVDGSPRQVLGLFYRHTAPSAGLFKRFKRLFQALRTGDETITELIETRCQRGATIALDMGFSHRVASAIIGLDEHWDGSGKPLGSRGIDIPILSRIALVAQVVDVFHFNDGVKAAIAEVSKRRGTWFDPAVINAFLRIAEDADFWETLDSGHVSDVVLSREPGQQVIMANEDSLDQIVAGFAQVIDAKSPYTAGHSDRVAYFTDLIAQEMNIDPRKRRMLRRAAILHDIGKLGVSSRILDKPGKLDLDEWEHIKRHPEYSEAILSRINAFAELAVIGGAHHERLNGQGYPRGLSGDQISLDVRIVAIADVFDALTADRPYRNAIPAHEALDILREGAGVSFDGDCIAALERALEKTDWKLAA